VKTIRLILIGVVLVTPLLAQAPPSVPNGTLNIAYRQKEDTGLSQSVHESNSPAGTDSAR
jgi:hypothetical protein